MSQNRHKTSNIKLKSGSRLESGLILNFETFFYSMIITCLAAVCLLAAGNAHASVPTATRTGKNPTYILKTNLDIMTKRDSAILDWRTQEFELKFDLPAHDWYESLDLFLSAYPEGKVTRGAPLLISYNGAKAVPIYGRSSRFDAHIRLDTSRIRLSGNSIKISYQTPRGSNCLTPDNGQWILDLSRSKLVANARAKKRDMQIVEIGQRLSHAMTAPKRVRITAKGQNKLAFEALAAQGIAQRMSFVPEFKLGNGLADMQFLIGTHDDVRPLLHNKSILSTQGAKVVIDSGRNPKIVLTAETEAQVLELVRAFATYKLPNVRRGKVYLQEFYASSKFEPHTIIGAKQHKLSDIGTASLAPSWRPDPAMIDFNVADPHATSGVLTLKILSAKGINPKSRLAVKLNDRPIGYTQLNKSSKMVEFRIKSGMFKASDNEISIMPEIMPNAATNVCASQHNIPTVLVSSASKLRMNAARPTPLTDLSRMAATGAPFDTNSTLVLTAKTVKDKQATLRLLGYAAQQFGPKWTNADYSSTLPTDDMRKNILIIGPNPLKNTELFSAAPTSMKLALGKRKLQSPKSKSFAAVDRFASTSSEQAFKTAARNNQMRNTQANRLASGGLAALFPSPYADSHMIGVISSDRPARFASAMNSVVVNTDYWNGLQGSVARWDKKTILMAQTATPLPASFALPKPVRPTNTPKFVGAAKDWFASLTTRTPSATVQTAPFPAKSTQTNSVQASPEQTKTGQTKTVQTVSNNPQIGVAQASISARQLRGALPARPAPRANEKQKKQWNISLPKVSKPVIKMPSMTSVKLKGYQTKRNIQAWWKKSSTTAFEASNMRKWGDDIMHNRAAFFGLLVFLAFFLTALFSPMTARLRQPKKKELWEKERIGKH